jgi:hypothetical protein
MSGNNSVRLWARIKYPCGFPPGKSTDDLVSEYHSWWGNRCGWFLFWRMQPGRLEPHWTMRGCWPRSWGTELN